MRRVRRAGVWRRAIAAVTLAKSCREIHSMRSCRAPVTRLNNVPSLKLFAEPQALGVRAELLSRLAPASNSRLAKPKPRASPTSDGRYRA